METFLPRGHVFSRRDPVGRMVVETFLETRRIERGTGNNATEKQIVACFFLSEKGRSWCPAANEDKNIQYYTVDGVFKVKPLVGSWSRGSGGGAMLVVTDILMHTTKNARNLHPRALFFFFRLMLSLPIFSSRLFSSLLLGRAAAVVEKRILCCTLGFAVASGATKSTE